MDNLFLMRFSELSHVLGGQLFTWEGKQNADPHAQGFSSISIDSRSVSRGGLFVALKGESTDGSRFVDAAFAKGAAGALVPSSAMDDPELDLKGSAQKWRGVLIAVKDTLKGLQDAAKAYLDKFPSLLKIGITGSSGKTTTKEIAAAIIGQEKCVIMNEGNLNTETGLPLAVFTVRAHHEVGIFEAGINRKGEMANLVKVLNPSTALITNIGTAHIGILGSKEGIAEEKKKIFSGVNTALIPESDEFRNFLASGINAKTVFYGASSLSGLREIKDLGIEGTEVTWEGTKVKLSLPGKHNVANMIAAIALALELNVSSQSICRGIEAVKPIFGRGEILYGRTTLLRDCYNASPEAMHAALDFCDRLQWNGRKVYVLGSMLELGDTSCETHTSLGKRLSSCKSDMLFLFGEPLCHAVNVLKDQGKNIPFFHTSDMHELSRALDAYFGNQHTADTKGDLVLLKGARGYEMERLTEVLTGQKGEPHVS